MSVYQRGKVFYTNFRVGGQRIRRPTGATTKRAAEKREREIRAEVEAEQARRLTEAMRPRTWGDALARWVREEKPESQMHHAKIVRDHIDDDTLIRDVPDAAMEMRWAMEDDGLSPSTIQKRLSICARVLNLAFRRWRWIDTPLAQFIEKPSVGNNGREVSCTYAELTTLLEAIEDEECRRMATAAAFTGLRKSELLRLGEDDWCPPFVTVGQSKNGRARRVPVAEALHHLFEPLPFRVRSDQYRYHVDKARRTSGLWRIRAHDLRHVFSTWLGNMPETPGAVHQSLMGHSDPKQTARYTHARDGVELVELLYSRVTEPVAEGKRPH